MNKVVSRSKKVLVGILGGLATLIGLVLVPYPGPGWLIVFAGLAILATEFEFADRILQFARGKYDTWSDWLKAQPIVIRIAVLALTGLVVVATLWLLNAFALMGGLVGINYDWLVSPIFR